jgi:DNA-binding MarR family transcriptional regulator
MSTPSPDPGLPDGTAVATGTPPVADSGPRAGEGEFAPDAAGDQDRLSPEALAAQAVAFSSAFERWAGRKATEAGASIPRLHLMYAIHCHGPQKMADLAESLMVTPRNVTALVDGLEAEGLVRRIPHSTDRRVTLVELACESRQVASQFETYQASIAALFDRLDGADRAVLARLFATLSARMRADCPDEADAPDA